MSKIGLELIVFCLLACRILLLLIFLKAHHSSPIKNLISRSCAFLYKSPVSLDESDLPPTRIVVSEINAIKNILQKLISYYSSRAPKLVTAVCQAAVLWVKLFHHHISRGWKKFSLQNIYSCCTNTLLLDRVRRGSWQF